MFEIFGEDYICIVWVKGLFEWVVIGKYGLWVGLIFVVIVVGFDIVILFGGVVIIE